MSRPEKGEKRLYKVICCCDGDTVVIGGGPRGRAREIIRLRGIDTPEKGQSGFLEAKMALEELCLGLWVDVIPERDGHFKPDRFGRTLAYIRINELLINAEIIRHGHSMWVTQWGRGRFSVEMREAEFEAETKKRGLFAKYESGEFFTWGRGRKKVYFRNSEERENYKVGKFKGRSRDHG